MYTKSAMRLLVWRVRILQVINQSNLVIIFISFTTMSVFMNLNGFYWAKFLNEYKLLLLFLTNRSGMFNVYYISAEEA